MAIPPLVLKIIADTTGMKAGVTQAESQVGGLRGTFAKQSAAIQLAAVAAGVAVVKFAADAVAAASDLNESINKVKVVFEGSSDEVIKWSETTSKSMGISQQAALESAGTFGNLFDAMGLAQDAGTKMSTTLVGLAADLASFNNASPEDVLAAMQSGLTGQIRPLRQYGIEISEAALKQEAMTEGITKSTAQMTMAEKVSLRYALILKQSGNAQGDFARTSEGLANQQRILNAQWQDLKAAIGTIILPTILDLVSGLNDLASKLETVLRPIADLGKGSDEAGFSVGGLFNAVRGLLNPLDQVIHPISRWQNAWATAFGETEKATESTSNLDAQLRDIAGTIPVVSDAFARLAPNLPKVAKAFRDTRDALLEEIPALRGTADTFKDTFTLKPQELVHITDSWAKIARTIASDLREIADSDLKPRMREAISALPPEMRNAWVEGTAKQRSAIEKSIQTTFSVQDQMPKLARDALTGGTTVGVSLTQGLVRGIVSGSPAVDAAARTAVLKAIQAARNAAEAGSPSRKMAELGHDMIEGLVQGLRDDEGKLPAAAEKLVGKLQDKLKGLISKASSFGQSIQEGFSSLFDISGAIEAMTAGTSPAEFFQGQLAQAQQFAHVLRALQTQGAGKALLSDIAGQGPSAIGFGQALLQGGPQMVANVSRDFGDIARIAEATANRLTGQFFGGDIILQIDGQTFARITRDELLKLKGSRVSLGLG